MSSALVEKHNELKKSLDGYRVQQMEAKAKLSMVEESIRQVCTEIQSLGVNPQDLSAKLTELEAQIRSEHQKIEQDLGSIPVLDSVLNSGLTLPK